MLPLRETGSILVKAPREAVFQMLGQQPDLRATSETRLESSSRTFVLRDAPGGTQVIHARTERSLNFQRRTDLRIAVEAELFRLQRLAEAHAP